MRFLLQFLACCFLGLSLVVLLLVGLMLVGRFDWIELLVLTGKPFAQFGLFLFPEDFWIWLVGSPGGLRSENLRFFLQLCVAMVQLALLLGLGFFRCWYRR